MEKILDAVLGLIEVITVTGVLGFSGAVGLKTLHHEVRKNTIEALARPTPSLSHFVKQLTKNSTH